MPGSFRWMAARRVADCRSERMIPVFSPLAARCSPFGRQRHLFESGMPGRRNLRAESLSRNSLLLPVQSYLLPLRFPSVCKTEEGPPPMLRGSFLIGWNNCPIFGSPLIGRPSMIRWVRFSVTPQSFFQAVAVFSQRPFPDLLGYRHGTNDAVSGHCQSISTVRCVGPFTRMRTFIVSAGSSSSIFSGHSTRQRSPE